jgi:protein gp37
MGDKSAIEWSDATWNPVRGCTRVSEGCRNCYAEVIAARFSDPGAPYHGFAERGRPGSKWTGRVDVVWPLFDLPLRWRRPRRIFVNSMSDLFHPDVDVTELASIYAVMVASVHLRGHTMQVLTKRPDHMLTVLSQQEFWDQVNAEAGVHVMAGTDPLNRRSDDARATIEDYGPENPPPGIWLGTSVENQAEADRRIPHLLGVPAAVRFLSCEPLLGPIDLTPEADGIYQSLSEWYGPDGFDPSGSQPRQTRRKGYFPRVQWVIVGGESGPGARPMHPDWARSLRDQCAAAAVPFFFKQNGEWLHESQAGWWTRGDDALERSPRSGEFYRVGKKAAGARLDGREWREMP